MDFPRTAQFAARVEVLAHTGSTNADLKERAGDAAAWPHLSVLLTRDQRAGRGRLDRQWQTPVGSALAVSTLLRGIRIPLESRGWIPLIAGLAMTEAVSAQLPDHEVALKWPNDVLAGGNKICGILAEVVDEDAIVVGTGINTRMTPEQLPVPTATSFAVLGVECDEDQLLADYLQELGAWLGRLAEADDALAAGLHAAVTSRCATLGLQVQVSLPDETELQGSAIELDVDGRLVVAVAGERHAVGAGDVVHVRPASG